jgi:hypothetical protein
MRNVALSRGSRKCESDAERIARMQRLQNRVIDLQIAIGDRTQDMLSGVEEIQTLKRELAIAVRDLEAFTDGCCRPDHLAVMRPEIVLLPPEAR